MNYNIIPIDGVLNGTLLTEWPRKPIFNDDGPQLTGGQIVEEETNYEDAVKFARSQCKPIAESDQENVKFQIWKNATWKDGNNPNWQPVDFTIYSDTGLNLQSIEQFRNTQGGQDFWETRDNDNPHLPYVEYRIVLKII